MRRCALWAAALSPLFVCAAALAQEETPSRVLAPGVLKVIPPEPEYDETFTGPVAVVEIVTGMPMLQWTPHFTPVSRTVYARAQQVTFRRDIWNLEFSFKPLRMVEVDVPQPSGRMQRKLIWYMVYRVRYLGNEMSPQERPVAFDHQVFEPGMVNREGRYFFPHMVLESLEYNKRYLDRIIPAAIPVIEEREKPPSRLLNSVEISAVPIPLSAEDEGGGLWGVVTWEDVDPRIDYFSIYIQGLTNAYQPVDVQGAFQPGDPPGTGREFLSKTLRLNFWRPGDSVHEHEEEIRFGVPVDPDPARQADILQKYSLRERVDYEWVYR